MRRSIGSHLIHFGLLCLILCGFLFWQRTTPRRLQFNNLNVSSVNASTNSPLTPAAIRIKSVGIELPIYLAKITNNKWEASDRGVSYLSSTPVPGVQGNSVLYGHNWKNMLGNLVLVKPGQIIEIAYSDGTIKNFEIKFTQTVTADQTEILNNSQDTRITLYTCTGFLDTKRFVVTAVLVE